MIDSMNGSSAVNQFQVNVGFWCKIPREMVASHRRCTALLNSVSKLIHELAAQVLENQGTSNGLDLIVHRRYSSLSRAYHDVLLQNHFGLQ